MEGMQTQHVLSGLVNRTSASPYWALFILCAFVTLVTRIKTGYLKSKLENQTESPTKDIPILPYYLPYLGHGPSFGWDFDGLLAKARDTAKDGVFGLHMMGKEHYMILMPSMVRQFFLQRPTVLSSDDFLFWIHEKYFGDGGTSRKMAADDFHTVHRTLNSLMKEPFLSTATQKTIELVEERTPEMLSLSPTPNHHPQWQQVAHSALGGDHVEVDLFPLVMNFVAEIAGTALMGKAFLENNAGIFQDLLTFDSGFNAFLTGVPTPTLATAKGARSRLNQAFKEWNHALGTVLKGDDPEFKWRDMSDVSETMRIRTKALQTIKPPVEFSVASNLAVYWGLMVNSNKVTFWMLLHIISTPTLLAGIRKEIKPYVTVTKNGDSETLKLDIDAMIKHCPLFKATFYETMRLYTAGTSYKKVLQDVTLTESDEDARLFGKPRGQTYQVSAGSYLVIPHATMQMDPRLWQNPASFSPERFLVIDEKNPEILKADMRHLNAFGGGYSVCKGRYFAEREILIFIAGFLSSWNFSSAGRGWTDPGKYYNGTGTANPKRNVRVRISMRTS